MSPFLYLAFCIFNTLTPFLYLESCFFVTLPYQHLVFCHPSYIWNLFFCHPSYICILFLRHPSISASCFFVTLPISASCFFVTLPISGILFLRHPFYICQTSLTTLSSFTAACCRSSTSPKAARRDFMSLILLCKAKSHEIHVVLALKITIVTLKGLHATNEKRKEEHLQVAHLCPCIS